MGVLLDGVRDRAVERRHRELRLRTPPGAGGHGVGAGGVAAGLKPVQHPPHVVLRQDSQGLCTQRQHPLHLIPYVLRTSSVWGVTSAMLAQTTASGGDGEILSIVSCL